MQGRITADWDDIDAAVEVGAGRAECVVVRQIPSRDPVHGPGPTAAERRYLLKHVSGRDGVLLVQIGAGPPPAPITLLCSMGRLGDPDLERRVVEGVEARLSDLRGRGFAPLRD